MEKNKLEALLKYHDNLYYNQDNPEISDTEYDALKTTYVDLYGEYNYVPGEASKSSVKFNHTTNVSSLDKVKIDEETKLKEEIERLWPVSIQPKMDGLTLVTYPDTIHVTRGNGKIGEIVTNNVVAGVTGIGVVKDTPIRSEIVMLKSEFERLNTIRKEEGLELFKNPRNAAAGMLRQKDSSKVKGLTAFAYNIIRPTEVNDPGNQLLTLKNLGWNTVDEYVPSSVQDAIDYINSYDRESLDYEIDGLVIKHNGKKIFGETGHHPKNAIAVKFSAEGQWTTINRVVWQVGRTGKITPVAEFDPIDILGSEVSRATLHNYGIMEALGLTYIEKEGKWDSKTQVFVIKANDVIPAITEVKHCGINELKDPYTCILHEPSECPQCKGAVEKIEDQIFCVSPDCPSKIIGRLIHMAKRDAFDIGGLSEKTAEKIMDTLVQQKNPHPSIIFDFAVDDFMKLESYAKKSATNLYNEIRKAMNIPFDRFLYGCGMPLVGRTASREIAEFYYDGKNTELSNFVEDYANNFEKLKTLKGIGKETIQSLLDNYEHMIIPFGEYDLNIFDVIPPKKADKELVFVITGAFEISRKEIEKEIKEAGHKVSGSVSSKTSYLLASPGEESTSKYKKAESLNTPIIKTLQEVRELL